MKCRYPRCDFEGTQDQVDDHLAYVTSRHDPDHEEAPRHIRAAWHSGQPLPDGQLCEWFALCLRPATGTVHHPVLGDVPTCDRCHDFAEGIGGHRK